MMIMHGLANVKNTMEDMDLIHVAKNSVKWRLF